MLIHLAENVADRMNEFQQLVQRTHKAGMKVIIDFVPNHVHVNTRMLNLLVKDLAETDHPEWHFSPLNNLLYSGAIRFNLSLMQGLYTEFPAKSNRQ